MTLPHIIAISGASGSGKSLFTETLCDELRQIDTDVLVLCEDHYYRDQTHLEMSEREKTNYDHPNAFEHELLAQHLRDLKAGKSIQYPHYCFKTHTRLQKLTEVTAHRVVVVEGILLLASPELMPLFDLKVYMDTPLDICLLRRIQRDLTERGRTLDSVAKQYEKTVKPMYHQFIQPCRHKANIVVTQGGKNRPALEVIKAHIRNTSKL
ncbi:uridine kinase [Neptunicella marina]|uniref:Uridine kinase n=1 Tax=Neptunicella marina TaxID=2125989 RepID=A0A8J6ITL7_9ALTE|nr:uridine kinase [Neptunicella marina]MBC3765378.1 uridine kinase [Neptunicella marina]